jgi:hypothetical protein
MSGKGSCLFYLRTKENPQAKVGAFKPEGFPIDYLSHLYILQQSVIILSRSFLPVQNFI